MLRRQRGGSYPILGMNARIAQRLQTPTLSSEGNHSGLEQVPGFVQLVEFSRSHRARQLAYEPGTTAGMQLSPGAHWPSGEPSQLAPSDRGGDSTTGKQGKNLS